MSKMTVIQLLNKIANGEEVPRKIAYGDIPYVYVGSNRGGIKYVNEEHDFNEGSRYLMYMIDDLNDEVEILEEKKIPEKLNLDIDELRGKETPRTIDYLIEDKINQVIDYLKSKGE